MTTLICDFQSIVGKKIKGYATLTAGQTRPAYDAPSVVVHDPIEKEVVKGRAVFENVNPGDAVITVDWEDQSSTIRFVVPNSEEDVYLSDCLTGDYFTPEEIDLLRWGIKEQISEAREIIETAANAGKSELTESISDYFSQAAETIRQTVEAAERAEAALDQINEKVGAVEGTVTTVGELQGITADALARIQALQEQLGATDADLVTIVRDLDAITPTIHDAATQAALAVQEAQSAASELLNLQETISSENARLNDEIEAANQEISQALTDLAGLNTRIGNEVSGILEEVSRVMATASQGVEDARLANDHLHTMQMQLVTIQDEQYEISNQQQTILSEFDARMAELDAIQTNLDAATSDLSSLTESHSQLTQNMTSKVSALQTLTQQQGTAITSAKQTADKGVSDAATALSKANTVNTRVTTEVGTLNTKLATAKTEAANAATAAQTAAEKYAKEKSEADKAAAEAAAATEALRVAKAEAAAAKKAAASDAASKAAAAEAAAKAHAEAKATAAKEAAEATAALEAKTQADKARADAEIKATQLAAAAQAAAEKTSQDVLDDLQIGGRNLARRRNLAGSSTHQTVVNTGETFWTGEPIYYGEKITSGTPPTSLHSTIRIEPGETYTISMWIRGETDSGLTNANILFYDTKLYKSRASTATGAPASEWHLISGTVHNDTDAAYESIATYFYINRYPGEKTWFTSPKLERGNKVTDWTPAPEDVEEGIAKAQAEAETARAEAVSKSDAARVAAELYAKEQAEAAQADAEVEAARVALEIAQREAKAAKDAAAQDATAKANAARTAAETLAKAEAKSARETAEANAAADAATKAENARIAAEANAKVLSDKAQQAAAAAQKQADKGVTDAATALAKANEANNKLPAITADVSAAAQTALEAVNALPGIRTGISTAKQRADKGVSDAATAKSAADTAKARADKGVSDAAVAKQAADKVGTDLENLEIGGRNLLFKSAEWKFKSSDNGGTTDRTELGKIEVLLNGSSWNAYNWITGVVDEDSFFDGKSTYTVSVELRVTSPGGGEVEMSFDVRTPSGSIKRIERSARISGTQGKWVKASATITLPNAEERRALFALRAYSTSPGDIIEYRNAKIERGTKATDWTPAPEDAQEAINALITKADDLTTGLAGAATQKQYNDLNTRLWGGQGEINKLQSDINANNTAFQTWQKTINDQQAKWNKASSDATAALARFAITQSQWNDISSKATNANTKAIASHAALFEGQNKWNEVAAAAIAAQATLLEKQELWNAAQKDVNDKQGRWNSAAKEILDSTGKFQKLQSDFNAKVLEWKRVQEDVNDQQQEINNLDTEINESQNEAISNLQNAIALATPGLDILPKNPETGHPYWADALTPREDPAAGVTYYGGINGAASQRAKRGIQQYDGMTMTYQLVILVRQIAGTNSGLSLRIRKMDGTEITPRHFHGTALDESKTLTNANRGTIFISPGSSDAIMETNGFTAFIVTFDIDPYTNGGDFQWTPTFTTNGTSNRFEASMQMTAYSTTTLNAINALNKATNAQTILNRNQEKWNEAAQKAIDANTTAIAAKKILDDNQTKWIQGANLAINHLQTFAADQVKWNKAAKDASDALFDITNEQGTMIQANKDLAAEISDLVIKQDDQLDMLRAVQEESATEVTRAFVAAKYGTNSGSELDDYIQIRKPSDSSGGYAVDARGQTWLGTMMISWIYSNGVPGTRTEKLSPTNSRTFVIPRRPGSEHSVDLAYLRVDYRVDKATQGRDAVSFTNKITVPIGWAELSNTKFVAPETAEYIISFSIDWVNTTRSGKTYGLRIRKGTTPVKTLTQDNIGPNFPWEDGRRTQRITWRGRVKKDETIYFDSCSDRRTTSNSYPTVDQRAVDNRSRIITWMRGAV